MKINDVYETQAVPGNPAERLAILRAAAKQSAEDLAALYAKWDQEPDTEFDTPEAFEQHKAAINANRETTGERIIYPDAKGSA